MSATGTSACRRRARWTTSPSASPTACWATHAAAAGLECTVHRADPALQRGHRHLPGRRAPSSRISTAGRCPSGSRVVVPAGTTLRLGAVDGPGARTYLRVRGGFDVPAVPGQPLDLHARPVRRTRRAGRCASATCCTSRPEPASRRGPGARPAALIPDYGDHWELRVLYGPHGAPDFFTARGRRDLLRHRLGGALQLEPHRRAPDRAEPQWARADGGEAGLHPSNIHDNAYAIGTVDFTGDMPVILGPDGPSLGGFVCPATIVAGRAVEDGPAAARRPVRFVPVERRRQPRSRPAAGSAQIAIARAAVAGERAPASTPGGRDRSRRLHRRAGTAARPPSPTARRATSTCWSSTARWCSTSTLRFRVHALMQCCRDAAHPRHHRSHARHPLAADPLRQPRPAPRARCSTSSLRAGGRAAGHRRRWRCRRASSTCRCPGTTPPRGSPSTSTCSRCARTRPGARATSSSSAASTGSTASRQVQRDRLRRELSGAWASATSISARRWPRRWTRAIAW